MTAYNELKKIFYQNSIISDIDNILQWDLSTIMPEKSRKNRVKQISYLSNLKQELFSNSEVNMLFSRVNEETLSIDDQSNFREMKKQFLYYQALPKKLIDQKTKLSLTCEGVWRKAKQEKKFKLVSQELKCLFAVIKEEGKILSEELSCSPYDALIKNYEESYSSKEIEKLFKKIHPFIDKIYKKIIKKQNKEILIPISKNLNEQQQFEISKFFMKRIGFNFNQGRLDKSLHPFCGGGINDIRITTRINKKNSFSAFEAVMHETGHALYEQGLPVKWKYQPAGESGGMALHESQSLLIEMQIMKSEPFQKLFSNILAKKFNLNGDEWNYKNLFKTFNRVKKSYIRVESDEVTYPLHIILRFNLEKKIIEDNFNINELPDLWNQEFHNLFGMNVDSDENGCLQDIHWYAGLFGYFPTYTLGALIASQIAFQIRKEIPEIDKNILNGNFKELVRWLKKNIHSKGSLFSTKKILLDCTKSNLNIKFFQNYITQKYL